MARVQFGAMITDVKGSIGGFTFHQNRSGNIVRARGGTFKNSTQKQTKQQSAHSYLLSEWQNLSLAEQTLWNSFAVANTKVNKFGETKTLTGANWFLSINATMLKFGLSILGSPPVHAVTAAPPAFDLTVTVSDLEIIWSPDYNPTDTGICVWTTQPVSRVTTSLRSAYRLTLCSTSVPFGTVDIKSAWETAHGIPWPPSNDTSCFTIGVMVQACSLTTGICSLGVVNLSGLHVPVTGIGFMEIGTNFVVS